MTGCSTDNSGVEESGGSAEAQQCESVVDPIGKSTDNGGVGETDHSSVHDSGAPNDSATSAASTGDAATQLLQICVELAVTDPKNGNSLSAT